MTRDDVIRMAREAQLICDTRPTTCWREDHDLTPQLEHFAALIATAEREACAKVCEQWEWANNAADAIRARGQQ